MYFPTAMFNETPVVINRAHLDAHTDYNLHLHVFHAGPNYRTTRPHGRSDWLFLLTHQGTGRLRQGTRRSQLPPGSLAVIEGGTPQDYGTLASDAPWVFSFAHSPPRPDWIRWIAKWPHPLPGIAVLQLEDAQIRERVERDMERARRLFHFETRSRIAFVENALETMILWANESSPGERPELDPRLRRATEQIGREVTRHWSSATLAREAGLSASRLTMLFRVQLGQSPVAYAERMRMEHAARLIQDAGLSVKEAADAVGYEDPYHFSRRFSARMGRPPSRFRRE